VAARGDGRAGQQPFPTRQPQQQPQQTQQTQPSQWQQRDPHPQQGPAPQGNMQQGNMQQGGHAQPPQQPFQQPQSGPHPQSQPADPQRSSPPYEPAAPPPLIQPVEPGPQPAAEPSAPGGRAEQQPLVRPYAMTGGRTRPRYQLAIEALVHSTAEPAQLQGQLPEHQRICRLCYEIKSIAEISALLSIPLGVARILVADLAEAGLVAIHQPGGDETTADGQPDVTLLERVLSGLRKL